MDKLKSRYSEHAFKGRRGFPVSMGASAIDKGPIGFGGENIVEMGTGAAGGFDAASASAGTPDAFDQNFPTSVYIHGTANYDGLRRIYNVRGGRYVQIFAKYVAEAFSGATQRVGYKAEVASEFSGFSFTGNAFAAGTLIVTNHSTKGSAFDNVLYSKYLGDVIGINHMFDPVRYLTPGDRIDVTIVGVAPTAGISLFVRKLK